MLFTIMDDAGVICRNISNPRKLASGETIKIAAPDSLFRTSNICQNMNVVIEQDAKVMIKIEVRERFRKDNFDLDASQGFGFDDVSNLWQRAALAAAWPLRRELSRPWFSVVARIGSVGGEEVFLDPDPKDGSISEVISATRGGQLILFVNDAVLAIPGLYDLFYKNNVGSAEVTITQLR